MADVLEAFLQSGVPCELVERALIERPHKELRESVLVEALVDNLRRFIIPRKSGMVMVERGIMQLAPGLVRISDVTFIPWSRLPGGEIPQEAIPLIVPALAVEVVNLRNRAEELERKRSDYFRAGVEVVWIVDPELRCVEVHHADGFETLRAPDRLEGGAILPGFELPLAELFGELDRNVGVSPS